ncbi:MAG: T9SS type A sorting domain-containing protein [Flavobacteriales bacterium]|nr:T9SS type A sorting domain-containing protein [Flavobacteriales bacterium]
MNQLILSSALAIASCTASAITVNIQITAHEICSYADGTAQAVVLGGVPPYTYLWSTGATTASVSGLSAGPISVIVVDSQSDEATGNNTVTSAGYQFTAISGGSLCPGDAYGGYLVMNELTANGPVTFSTPYYTGFYMGDPIYSAYYTAPYGPLNNLTLHFTDANGCAGELFTTGTLGQPTWTTPVILDVQGACAGGANGSIQALLQHSPTYARTWHQLTDGAGSVHAPDGSIVGTGSGTYGHTPLTNFDNVNTWTGLAAGEYWLTQVTNFAPYTQWQPGGGCGDSVLVTIPDLGPSCSNISGKVFMDYDEDCVKTGVEPLRTNSLLQFEPGPYFASTGANGVYSLNVPNGTYDVTEITSDAQQHCLPEPITVNANGLTVLDFADTALVDLDVQITIASGAARPGFELAYAIDMANLTPGATGNNQVVMSFDPILTFLGASVTPSSSTGSSLTWNNVGNMNNFTTRELLVRFQVPTDVGLIGTQLNASAIVTPAMTDAIPANNTATWVVTVTGSYDPNDKLANTSHGNSSTVYLIEEDEWIDYTIRFQNTGTDTAFLVVITDTLPQHLDPSTIRMGAGSHGFSWSLSGQGTLRWVFPNILLPDSNVNEPRSHGFVSFRIRPYEPLLPGTTIENTANIHFDFNPPVVTEPSVLVAEFSTGVAGYPVNTIQVWPVPAKDRLNISASSPISSLRVVASDGREVDIPYTRTTLSSLDVSGLQPGAYLLEVRYTEGTDSHQRFIIQE